jgi:purine-binding chemotaxis protein CheW
MIKATKLVVFHLEAQRYALYLEAVERVVRAVQVTPLPEAPLTVLGIINAQGTLRPVIDVRKRFGLALREPELSDRLILARLPRHPVALLVDAVEGVLVPDESLLAPAERIAPALEITAGAVKLEDGLILISDLERFLSLEDEKKLKTALQKLTKNESSPV